MLFPLRVAKTVHAIGVLLRQDGVRSMNYMRLLKLLYIADRESLRATGRPIVGGSVIATERGPVLGEVYDLIRGRHREMPLWDVFLRTSRFNVELVDDPDVGELSRYEIDMLQQVAKRYADDGEWELSRRAHEFAEWKKNNLGPSASPIPLEDVLEAVGRADALRDIVEAAAEKNEIERLLGC